MTQEELATNARTLEHIRMVSHYLHIVAKDLLDRADGHDSTKLEQPELAVFSEYTPRLAALTYGSDEYAACLEAMGEALEHHYARNRHHPEHFPDGVNDMSLVDLLEMFCDWKASSVRQNNGNLLKSIEANGKRFRMSPQLTRIFENTADLIEQRG